VCEIIPSLLNTKFGNWSFLQPYRFTIRHQSRDGTPATLYNMDFENSLYGNNRLGYLALATVSVPPWTVKPNSRSVSHLRLPSTSSRIRRGILGRRPSRACQQREILIALGRRNPTSGNRGTFLAPDDRMYPPRVQRGPSPPSLLPSRRPRVPEPPSSLITHCLERARPSIVQGRRPALSCLIVDRPGAPRGPVP
jgi:hypothetical protein